MSDQDLLNFLNSLEGQCQQQRFPAELAPQTAPIDPRTTTEIIEELRTSAAITPYPITLPDGTDVDRRDGNRPPHHGLLLAIARLLQHPQELLNRYSERHLDLQFRQILGFQPRPAIANRVWAVVELKTNAEPRMIGPDEKFSAGETSRRTPQLFRPVRPVYVHHAQVGEVGRQRVVGGRVCADRTSFTNLWSGDQPQPWQAFGATDLPPSQVGFAVASPLLRLNEGTRIITLRFSVIDPKQLLPALLSSGNSSLGMEAEYTGPKGWLIASDVQFTLTPVNAGASVNQLCVRVKLDPSLPAMTDLVPTVHGDTLQTTWPLLRFRLGKHAPALALRLSTITVQSVSCQVEVKGIRNVVVRNSLGIQDSRRPIAIFGPTPNKDRATIICPELSGKKIQTMELRLDWKNGSTPVDPSTDITVQAPGFSSPSNPPPSNPPPSTPSSEPDLTKPLLFTASGGSGKLPEKSMVAQLVDDPNVLLKLRAMQLNERSIAELEPAENSDTAPRIEVDLTENRFDEYIQQVMVYAKRGGEGEPPIKPRYEVGSIEFGYSSAVSIVDLSERDHVGFSCDSIQFFHLDSFGGRREHATMRVLSGADPRNSVPLIPDVENAHEFYFGFHRLRAGDTLSLLFDIDSEGNRWQEQRAISWSVLCGNHWKRLTGDELLIDTTNHLEGDGLFQFVVPSTASTQHTIMPAGKIWLRASAPVDLPISCRMRGVYCHAAELEFDSGDLEQAASPIPPGTVSALDQPSPGVKRVVQPLPGFGGRSAESTMQLYRRAAERLRHRNRAVTIWDYERLVLEEFPEIERVKCIPHADGNCWQRPGHVTVVVVPRVKRLGSIADREPRLPPKRLTEIQEFLRDRAVLGVSIHVINPCYQAIQCQFQVRFQAGLPFHFYRLRLQERLIAHLAPWVALETAEVRFGTTIYRSAVLDFVEDLEFVDFVTEFSCFLAAEPDRTKNDWMLQTTRPDGVLVSTADHLITEYSNQAM